MSDPRFNTGDAAMDKALAEDDAKLEALGAYGMTPDQLDHLLALCEAAPESGWKFGFTSAVAEYITKAREFYDAWYERGPTLIAHCKSETARADEADRKFNAERDITLAIVNAADDYRENKERAERAEAKLAQLREARGGVTEVARKAAYDAGIKAFSAYNPKAPTPIREVIDVALDAALPHLVLDRGPMPEQRVSDETLENWCKFETAHCAHDLRDLRAWAKQQDAGGESGWQPIETAPRDGTVIDLWSGGQRFTHCRWGLQDMDSKIPWGKFGWNCTGMRIGSKYIPTHWMPLPPPPAQEPSR